jgi:uncharacterized SAM-binding protein YcdF (DUF218 family)
MDLNTAWLVKNLLGSALLPPLNGLLLLVLAFLCRARRGLAWGLATVAVLLLTVLSLKPVGQWLLAPLEAEAGFQPPTAQQLKGAGAIVILGGGRYRNAPEYGEDTVTAEALARLRYGALLARRSGLPVLVSGGKPDGGGLSEAEAMARVFEREWGLRVRWRESGSGDTADNARESARLLQAAGVRRVVLVSHAYHLPRARRMFERAGLTVVPAATSYFSRRPLAPQDWLPQAEGMRWVRLALHEWIGLGWDRLRSGQGG